MTGAAWSVGLWTLVGALALDALIGDPDAIWRRVPHPVTWLGALVALLDRRLNDETKPARTRRMIGVVALGVLVAVAALAGIGLTAAFHRIPGGGVLIAFVATIFLAQASLYRHVERVRAAFGSGNIFDARRAVSMIVGRDTQNLDAAAVSRAAIESCAENFSDGVVAPAFWFALLGLPGLLIYKAVNTADSMIGHRTPRHEDFGWASARCDDALNLAPARLAGVLIALVAPFGGGRIVEAFRVMLRDARLHRSPNAGWPEAAMAGALGLALGGPRRYGEAVVDEPFLNPEGRDDATPLDIARALRLLVAACVLHAALYAAVAFVLWRLV